MKMTTVSFDISPEQKSAMRAGKLVLEVSIVDGELLVQEIREVRD